MKNKQKSGTGFLKELVFFTLIFFMLLLVTYLISFGLMGNDITGEMFKRVFAMLAGILAFCFISFAVIFNAFSMSITVNIDKPEEKEGE